MLNKLRRFLTRSLTSSILRELDAGNFEEALKQSEMLHRGREHLAWSACYYAKALIALEKFEDALVVLEKPLALTASRSAAALKCNCLHDLERYKELLEFSRSCAVTFNQETTFFSYAILASNHLKEVGCELEKRKLLENEENLQEWERIVLDEYQNSLEWE